jgi:hypothetical protein
MNATQAEKLDEFVRSGWKKGTAIDDRFVTVYRRDSEHNYQYPAYIDLTIFPNGRYAEGTYRRYPTYRR